MNLHEIRAIYEALRQTRNKWLDFRMIIMTILYLRRVTSRSLSEELVCMWARLSGCKKNYDVETFIQYTPRWIVSAADSRFSPFLQ